MQQIRIGRKLFDVLSRNETSYILHCNGRYWNSPLWLVRGILNNQDPNTMGIRRLDFFERNEAESHIATLVESVKDRYGLQLNYRFTRVSHSYHRVENNGSHLITFGTAGEGMAFMYHVRYTEYSCLDYILSGRVISGMEAIHYLTCHELAHCWQAAVPHGKVFAKFYQHLLNEFPFPLDE